MTTSYRQLIVWQKSIELVEKIYLLTSKFPGNELFGLTSQIKRADALCFSLQKKGESR